METYVIRAVQGKECVRRKCLASSSEGMAYLEERVDGETLVQFRAQTREGEVVEKDASLHLPIDLVYGPRVAETKRCSSIVERLICVHDAAEEAIGLGGREGDRRC